MSLRAEDDLAVSDSKTEGTWKLQRVLVRCPSSAGESHDHAVLRKNPSVALQISSISRIDVLITKRPRKVLAGQLAVAPIEHWTNTGRSRKRPAREGHELLITCHSPVRVQVNMGSDRFNNSHLPLGRPV